MEKSILQKLYDGEVYPSENIRVDTPEYHKIKAVLADERERLLKTQSEHNRECFGRIEELHYELANAHSYAGFAHGFKLAVSLIIESQNDENSNE